MSENDPVSDQRGHPLSECEFADRSRLDLLVVLRRRASALLPEERLRCRLDFALPHSGPQGTTSSILGALAALAVDANDPRLWNAYNMVETGIQAIVFETPEQLEEAHNWHAQRQGCDPKQDAISIRDLKTLVEIVAPLYHRSEPWLESKGRVAVQQFRDQLVQQFGENIPPLDDLEDWISNHGPTSARGRTTTTGIVARIMHNGRLLGARGNFEKTLKRVDNALARQAGRQTKRPRKKRKPKGRRDHSTQRVE